MTHFITCRRIGRGSTHSYFSLRLQGGLFRRCYRSCGTLHAAVQVRPVIETVPKAQFIFIASANTFAAAPRWSPRRACDTCPCGDGLSTSQMINCLQTLGWCCSDTDWVQRVSCNCKHIRSSDAGVALRSEARCQCTTFVILWKCIDLLSEFRPS